MTRELYALEADLAGPAGAQVLTVAQPAVHFRVDAVAGIGLVYPVDAVAGDTAIQPVTGVGVDLSLYRWLTLALGDTAGHVVGLELHIPAEQGRGCCHRHQSIRLVFRVRCPRARYAARREEQSQC